jgi:hypothetical protein
MDPTQMPMMPGQAQAMAGTDPNMAAQNALKNAALLQAIKGGASGGGAPPMGATQNAMGAQQMPTAAGMGMPAAGAANTMGQTPAPPVNPASMTGGVGSTPPMGTQMPMMQAMGGQNPPDPVTSALFSSIPGAQ